MSANRPDTPDLVARPGRQWLRGSGVPIGVAVLGLAVTLLAFLVAERSERNRAVVSYSNRAQVRTAAILAALRDNVNALASLADYFEASEHVEPDEFRLIASRLRTRFPTVLSFRWTPVVPQAHRESFEAEVATLLSGIQIREWSDGRLQPATVRDEYFPILYAEPEQAGHEGERLFGVDLGSLSDRAVALRAARHARAIVATGSVKPFWRAHDDEGALVAFFAPVNQHPRAPESKWAGTASLAGFCVMVVRIDQLVGQTLDSLPSVPIDLALLQRSDGGEAQMLVSRRSEGSGAAHSELRLEDSERLAGVTWTVRCTATQAALAEARTAAPYYILAFGIVLSGVLGLYLLALSRRQHVLERAVQHRTAALSRSLSDLTESEQRFRSMFELAAVAMAQVNMQTGHFLNTNARFAQLTGYSHAELRRMRFIELTHPEDRGREADYARRVMESASPQYFIEKRYLCKDGRTVWVRVNAAIFYDEQRRPQRSVAVIQDVTDEKQAVDELRRLNVELEQRVAERTVALEAATRELEAFNYSVSHDLRAPLRHASGFASLLLKREQQNNRLDEQSMRYLDTIVDAVQRMGALIDELLAFSRTSRTELRPQPVDSRQLVESVRGDLMEQSPERDVQWRVDDLPVVQADAGLLRIVWTNLLSNALKYTSRRARAAIEIGANRGPDGRVTFHVRDNGAGFDMQYADKLFGVFQRLHRSDEFEGSGIGLATVRRIVHRHGGTVWAEGEPDRGATFYFTLPGANGELA